MSAVSNTIAEGLSANVLWGEVSAIMPVVIVSVLFGLGFYLVKRVLNKIKKGKGGI